MLIHISNDFKASPKELLLGYQGEHNARTIEFEMPDIADTYILRFEYSDGLKYDAQITNNKLTITGSMLREVGDIDLQWLAFKQDGQTYELVAKSQIFKGVIRPSISDDIAPIPTYEQSLDMLDQLNEGINSKITEPEQDGTAGQVLATDGNGERYWRTVSGGGSGGEDGATFIPSVSVEGIISWTNNKGLPNPEPVNIKGQQGERGTTGDSGATYTPSVSVEGVISWTNDKGLPNPESVNIKGVQGDTGATGADGIGITNATINSSNELVLTYSNGQTANLGVVVGADGKDGKDGYTPVRGTDYWTASDIATIDNYIDNAIGNVNSVLETRLNGGAVNG